MVQQQDDRVARIDDDGTANSVSVWIMASRRVARSSARAAERPGSALTSSGRRKAAPPCS